MSISDRNLFFWRYISAGQKGLIEEGLYLLEDIKLHPDPKITDYSYLVFPFAKAYEGFLKQVFLDKEFITTYDYQSDHFRIGKVLNPSLEKRLRHISVYDKIIRTCGDQALAMELWQVWKIGRNAVFHYFPHNFKALTFDEAKEIIDRVLKVMEKTLTVLQITEKSGS